MGLVAAMVILAGLFLVPTYFGGKPEGWPGFLPGPIRLGLDLQGGTHLVYTVDVDKAIENHLERAAEDLKNEARNDQIGLKSVSSQNGVIAATLSDPSKRLALEKLISDRFPNLSIGTEGGDDVVRAKMTPATLRDIRDGALDQSLEIIRNRVDQFGVSEPIVQRQGAQDILVQLPGIQDPERAKALIGKTAALEFKLVAKDPSAPGVINMPGREIDRATGRVTRTEYKLEPHTLMTGDVIANARPRPGTQLESPYVELDLNSRGAKIFEEITRNNVGRQLAIILDGVVQSAPVIQEPITGGHARITGSFDFKDARDLALVLRTGALPAPVHVIEERTVGPSLGKDSIHQGIISFIVGGSLVVVFMLVYYKFAGVLADFALVLNVVFLLAALAAFGATLTLPGIAGVVLTLGMAVDANVLVNERMREELRLGKTPRAVIDSGYERALPAILDSNITTFLSGIILFQFGSGPVKGFAVTLCIGIVSSVFTAVVGTRVVYDYLLSHRRLRTVSV
jgi:preprotein translocase subunit SecD